MINLDDVPFNEPTEEKDQEEKDLERIRQNPEL